MNNLSALRERVEKAEGSDREIDREIYAVLFQSDVRASGDTIQVNDGPVLNLPRIEDTPELTASMDAAVGLIKSRLPQAKIHMHFSASISEVALTVSVEGFSNDTLLAHYLRPDDQISLVAIAALLSALESTNG